MCFARLNRTYHQLLKDNEELSADHKQLKSQMNEARLERTWLEADFSKLKKQCQQLDITSTKLTNQCEVHICSTEHYLPNSNFFLIIYSISASKPSKAFINAVLINFQF